MLTTNLNKLNDNTTWVVTWSDGLVQETKDMEAARFQERYALERQGKKIVDTWIKDDFCLIILNGTYVKKIIRGKEKARKYVDKVRKSGGKVVYCAELTDTASRLHARKAFEQLTTK